MGPEIENLLFADLRCFGFSLPSCRPRFSTEGHSNGNPRTHLSPCSSFRRPLASSATAELPSSVAHPAFPPLQILFESATGLALFSSSFFEEIGKGTQSVQDSVDDISKFGKMVKLVSFIPFQDAAHALEVANDVSEGKL